MGALDGLADIIADVIVDEGLGASITYTSAGAGTYDPATGTNTGGSTSQTVVAIVEDFKGLELLNGDVIEGDKKVSIPAPLLTATPKPSDTATVNGIAYAVVGVNNTQAGEEIVLHVLQCRRA
jgi:hypothetical protein